MTPSSAVWSFSTTSTGAEAAAGASARDTDASPNAAIRNAGRAAARRGGFIESPWELSNTVAKPPGSPGRLALTLSQHEAGHGVAEAVWVVRHHRVSGARYHRERAL